MRTATDDEPDQRVPHLQRRWATRSTLTSHFSLLTSTAAALTALLPFARAEEPAPPQPPNIVFVLIDDMRWDVMSCAGHPFVKTPNIDRIAASGVRFTNAFVTTSLCSPSRASFLTGAYAHTHGVRVNAKMEPDRSVPTFPRLLQRAGYETAFIGKWHMKYEPEPRPGFDYWLSFPGQGSYIDPDFNENGRNFKRKGYMTDLLTEYAVSYLERPRSKPFCLCLSHKAMHGEFIPAERHKRLYEDIHLPAPASYRDDLRGKPRWQREVRLRGGRLKHPVPPGGIPDAVEPEAWDLTSERGKNRMNWHRTLAAIDEGLGQLLDTLRKTGVADNTVIIFAGDNGFFLGEHGRPDKRLAYEESMRIPLLISGTGVKPRGIQAGQMVLNIDVAPTILDLAGVKIPSTMQGRSLGPMLAGDKPPWRTSFLYEYFKEDWLPGIPTMQAVRTANWKYVRYPDIDDVAELYDLTRDPQEMHNRIDDPGAKNQLAKMRTELERLLEATRR